MTSSLFGKVAKKKKWENMSNFVFNNFFKTADYIGLLPSIRHGNEMEPKIYAIYSDMISNAQVVPIKSSNQGKKGFKNRQVLHKWLSKDQTNPGIMQDVKNTPQKKLKVVPCGFWTKKEKFFLGGTPDGLLINEETGEILKTLEIKCPYFGKEKSVKDLVEDKILAGKYSQFYLRLNQETNEFSINKSHNYYHQIQGVMEIVGCDYCDFMVATEVDSVVISVKRDKDFVYTLLERLKEFYFRFLLPNFCRTNEKGAMELGLEGSYIELS